MRLQVGSPAPEFDLVASNGARLRLADFRGTKNVVLYFYPKDFTSVCTAEACGFRDMYDLVRRQDTEVIGVSFDTDETHRRFAEAHGLPFPLVSDARRDLAKRYGAFGGVRSLLGIPKRVTFVIDKQGEIAGIFEGELSSRPHLDGVRNVLDKLA
jgi:peroxiredoxin Q/BCP